MPRKAAGRKHTSVSTVKALGAYKGHWFSFYHRWAYLYFLRAHWLNVDLINVYFAISSRSMSSKVYKVRPISCSAQKHSISCRCLLQITKLEKNSHSNFENIYHRIQCIYLYFHCTSIAIDRSNKVGIEVYQINFIHSAGKIWMIRSCALSMIRALSG